MPPARLKFGLYPRLGGQIEVDKKVRDMATQLGIKYISTLDMLCNQQGCLTRLTDDMSELTQRDGVHLSPVGSKYVFSAMYKQLFNQDLLISPNDFGRYE